MISVQAMAAPGPPVREPPRPAAVHRLKVIIDKGLTFCRTIKHNGDYRTLPKRAGPRRALPTVAPVQFATSDNGSYVRFLPGWVFRRC